MSVPRPLHPAVRPRKKEENRRLRDQVAALEQSLDDERRARKDALEAANSNADSDGKGNGDGGKKQRARVARVDKNQPFVAEFKSQEMITTASGVDRVAAEGRAFRLRMEEADAKKSSKDGNDNGDDSEAPVGAPITKTLFPDVNAREHLDALGKPRTDWATYRDFAASKASKHLAMQAGREYPGPARTPAAFQSASHTEHGFDFFKLGPGSQDLFTRSHKAQYF